MKIKNNHNKNQHIFPFLNICSKMLSSSLDALLKLSRIATILKNKAIETLKCIF